MHHVAHDPPRTRPLSGSIPTNTHSVLVAHPVSMVRDSPANSIAIALERLDVIVQHDAIVDDIPVTLREFALAQRTCHAIACGACFRRLTWAAISLAKRAIGVRVRDGFDDRFQRAPEVHKAENVDDDVVEAVLAVALAFSVVATDLVLPEEVGRCRGRQR
jgi:hypothetical protein